MVWCRVMAVAVVEVEVCEGPGCQVGVAEVG